MGESKRIAAMADADTMEDGGTELERPGGQPSVRALRRGIRILRLLNHEGPMTVQQVGQKTGMPRITAYRLLLTLEEEGLVERSEDSGTFRVASGVLSLSSGYSRYEHLVRTARPILSSVCCELGWPLVLATNNGPKMVIQITTRHLTNFDVQEQGEGGEFPLLTSASGLAFVAHCDEPLRRDLINAALADISTVQSSMFPRPSVHIQREIERIRAEGFAYVPVSWRSLSVNLSAMGVPLFESGKPCAALSVAFYQAAIPRSQAVSRFLRPLQAAAQAISAQLHSDSSSKNAAQLS